ncbi:MAG: FtsX-like permease family protein [Deltaproteobacteria bacterium]
MPRAPELSSAAGVPRHFGRRAKRFSWRAAGLTLGGTLVAALVGLLLKALLLDRLAWSEDSVLALAVALLGGLLAVCGFVAGWAARKLCFLEVVLSALLAAGLAHLPWLVVLASHQPWALAVEPQTYEMWALVGTLGVGLALFLGSSLGFMLAGGGKLDLGFRYEAFVALTFLKLRGQGRRGRFSPSAVVTVIAILSVVIGVMALTIVLSVMSGFELDLKKKILGTNAHAVVLKYGNDFTGFTGVEKKVHAVPGVIGVTPFTLNEVMVSSDQNLSGVVLKGIDPKTVGSVTDLGKDVIRGDLAWLDDPGKIPVTPEGDEGDKLLDRLDQVMKEEAELDGKAGQHPREAGANAKPQGERPEAPVRAATPKAPAKPLGQKPAAAPAAGPVLPGIVLGTELSHSLHVDVGDVVHVVSPLGNELGPTGPIPKSRPFRVAAIFYSGMYEYDSKFAYLALGAAQKYFDMGGAVTGLEIKVNDVDRTRKITRDILFALDGYPFHTKDWGEMNRNLFAALAMEKLVMAIILGFASLPVGFLILAILMFLAFEKSKEIAVLKSMGARDQSVMKVFVIEGLVIGGVGAGLGLVVGLLVCLFIAHGGIKLDPSVYYIESLPVRIEGWQFGVVALSALVLSYLATIYPALAASRLAPVEGLRND